MSRPADPNWRCCRCGSTGRGKQHRRHNKTAICQGCNRVLRAAGLRWCGRCRRPVPVAEIASSQSFCRACDAARKRRSYHADRTVACARARAYRAAHRARINAQSRAYHWRNRPDVLRRMKLRRVRRVLAVLRAPMEAV